MLRSYGWKWFKLSVYKRGLLVSNGVRREPRKKYECTMDQELYSACSEPMTSHALGEPEGSRRRLPSADTAVSSERRARAAIFKVSYQKFNSLNRRFDWSHHRPLPTTTDHHRP